VVICNQITLLILYYISSRLLTILKVIDAPIHVPSPLLKLLGSFKFLNFSFQVYLIFVPEMPASIMSYKYSELSIFRFWRERRKWTKNVRERKILKTTFKRKSRILSFASRQNFSSIENIIFQDLKCVHGPRQLHCAHRKTL
jgi:hypothetical protein